MSGVEAVLNSLVGVDRGRNVAWVDDALCATPGIDPDIWFPPPPNTGFSKQNKARAARRAPGYGAREVYAKRVAYAISICDDCPVKARCLADAESRQERYGVWGGKDFHKTKAEMLAS